MIDSRPADRLFVEERFTAKRCIDDQINLAALDIVNDVRPAFVDFINRFDFDAEASEYTCGSSRRDNLETDFDKVCSNFRNEILVVLIDADERHSALWQ